MADETKKRTGQDIPPEYEPPRATRLRDLHGGSGGTTCSPVGSGGVGGCTANGNTATPSCNDTGNSAAACNSNGSAPTNCVGPGLNFT